MSVETAIKSPVPIKDIVQPASAKPTEPPTEPPIELPIESQVKSQPAEPLPTPPTVSDPLPQNKISVIEEETAVSMEDDPDLPADRILQEEENEEDTSYLLPIQQTTTAIDDSLVLLEPKEDENQIDMTTLSPFGKSWITMCDTVLSSVPALYHLFKLNIPQYENHIITVVVNNGIAEAFFSDKKREILAYMRNNFDIEIEDIVLDIQTEAVQKKFLLSNQEQAELLHQQNSELSDFMNLLELKLIE